MAPPNAVTFLVRASWKVWTCLASRARWTTRLKAFVTNDAHPSVAIANARAIVAVCTLVVGTAVPHPVHPLFVALLGAYSAYAVVAAALLRRCDHPRLASASLGIDLTVPVVLSAFGIGPDLVTGGLYAFALVVAAASVGRGAACAAAAASIAALVTVGVWTRGGVLGIAESAAFLILLALVVGATVSNHSRARAETLCLLRLRERVRLDLGFRGSLQALLGDVVDLFQARGVQLRVRHEPSGREFTWVFAPSDGEFVLRRTANLEDDGPDRLPAPFDAPFAAGDWNGRVKLIGADVGEATAAKRLFVRLVRDLALHMRQIHVLARLRSRVQAAERGRLARLLHDEVLQSLVVVEMRLDGLQADVGQRLDAAMVAAECVRLRDSVHAEVLNLRDLMMRMKPIDVSPDDLPAALEELVDRFGYNHGIDVTFETNIGRASLSPSACTEVVRIVREALINARKHGGARRASVRLTATETGAMLVIEDDGRGFDPYERSAAVLVDTGRGRTDGARLLRQVAQHPPSSDLRLPAEIAESVRSLRGDLTIESTPRRGTHLRIALPADKAFVSHARNRMAAS